MKRLIILSLLFWPLLSMAQDDMYFVPSKKKAKADVERVDLTPRAETVRPAAVEVYNDSRRSEDEYNRRFVNVDGYMADTLQSDSSDTYSSYEDDPEADFRYSRRLVRFHSPRLYAIASPYYWDLCYSYGAWDYLYDPFDPWYWHYGWGYGWSWGPWDCWCGGIWGYTHPHHWAYWGWGPCWHAPVHGVVHYRNTVPREYNSSRGHMAAHNTLRTSALGRYGVASASSGRTSSRASVSAGRSSSGRGQRSDSYTSYVDQRSGRTNSAASRGAQPYEGQRSSAAARAQERRAGQPVRSQSNQNSSSRVGRTRSDSQQTPSTPRTTTRSSSTPSRSSSYSNSTPSRSSSSGYSTPSRSSSSGFGGGGSRGGGGGGGSRGGGGRR